MCAVAALSWREKGRARGEKKGASGRSRENKAVLFACELSMEDSPVAADGVKGEMEKGKKEGEEKREGKCVVVCFCCCSLGAQNAPWRSGGKSDDR